jgi:hypothetical protein
MTKLLPLLLLGPVGLCLAQVNTASLTSSSGAADLSVKTIEADSPPPTLTTAGGPQDLSATGSGSANNAGNGPALTARVYKKKVLAAAFAVSKPGQVQDIEDIAHGFPRELLLRLENSRAFVTRSSPDLLSLTMQADPPGVNLVKQVAAQYDSQFIIAGEVRNAGVQVASHYFGLWTTRSRPIDIELSVYDGVSGALLARHNLHQQVEDQGKIGRERPFGSSAFFATGYGKAIDTMLDEAARLIAKDLQPHPVLARILKVSNGQVIFDVGETSSIVAGDMASVVSGNNELPTLGLRSHQAQLVVYGAPQTNVGKMVVTQVQYLFSVGDLAVGVRQEDVRVGDFIRFDNVPLQ